MNDLSNAATARLHISRLAAGLADYLITRVVTVPVRGDLVETPERLLAEVQRIAERAAELQAAAMVAAKAAGMTWDEIGEVLVGTWMVPPRVITGEHGKRIRKRWWGLTRDVVRDLTRHSSGPTASKIYTLWPDPQQIARHLDNVVRQATGYVGELTPVSCGLSRWGKRQPRRSGHSPQ